MARTIWFMIKLAVVVAAALWIADNPGTVNLDWQGWRVAAPLWVLALAVVALMAFAALLYRGWRAIVGAPRAFVRARRARKREKGYRALTQGLVAVAAGDPASAKTFAKKADVLLNEPPLTLLLSAQAAQLGGDETAAARYFRTMLDNPQTAFLGVRGLLMQALRRNDHGEALLLARRAQQIQPKTPWVLATLFELEARAGNWSSAEAALRDAVHVDALPAPVGRRHRAALLVEQSDAAAAEGRREVALAAAQQAHDLDVAFAPAAVRVARLLWAAKRPRPALKAVERSWKARPHPDLAAVWGEMVDPGTDVLAQVKRFQTLVGMAPEAPEGHLALAEIAMRARLWGEARKHLTKVADRPEGPGSRRAFRMLAELEEAERGDRDAARRWLARAAEADPDPAWICSACGSHADRWSARCAACGSFDTLSWQVPGSPVAVLALPAGSGAGVPADMPGLPPAGGGSIVPVPSRPEPKPA
jgi:HemY protein